MITCTAIGKRGRLGNSLFQIAATIGTALRTGQSYILPDWKYKDYFPNLKEFGDLTNSVAFKETTFSFDDKLGSSGEAFQDIGTWLQSPRYWEGYEQQIKSLFKFDLGLVAECHRKFGDALQNNPIGISIRRGDFVGNGVYYQIPLNYYLKPVVEAVEQGRNILFFSDDMEYCRMHFECLPNAYFIDGIDIEQLCVGSRCKDLVISNSTFSWWMAYLSDARITRPEYNFSLEAQAKPYYDEKDFWPSDWEIGDEDYKIDLSDHTFLIPVKYDHPDRYHNLSLGLCILQRYVNTETIIGEQGGSKFRKFSEYAYYMAFEYAEFHRTKMLNVMSLMGDNRFIVNWDADNIIPPMQLYMAARALRSGANVVYPFDGRVNLVHREPHFKQLVKHLDPGILTGVKFTGRAGQPRATTSVGHCVFHNWASFIAAGMENENFMSYGPEDSERWHRHRRLGFDVQRVKGAVFHLEHYRGPDSGRRNPAFKANFEELRKEEAMTDAELREYVDAWPWKIEAQNTKYEILTHSLFRGDNLDVQPDGH